MKLVIVGGVAGGASAAARARRMSEDAEIIMLERGPDISFANCGMPYHIGGVIEERDKLLVATPQLLRKRFNIDVRTLSEVTGIDREQKQVTVKNHERGETYQESYDKLILATGAEPIIPPVPGVDSDRVLTLRNIQHMDEIKKAIERGGRKAVVVGGGFIGIEMAENLRSRDVEVHLVEMLPQVMPPLDCEMAQLVHEQLELHGVHLHLDQAASGFKETDNGLIVVLPEGEEIQCDFAILAVGVRPSTKLAKMAELEIGSTGGVKVDAHMRTSDPDIYAVGDMVEVKDFVTGQPALIPLAGPANRQGRIAADNAFGREAAFRGTQGTAIVKVFDLHVAHTGPNERKLDQVGIAYEKVYVHPGTHAGYYPGASPLQLKLLFSPEDGRVLGAQVVGVKGVDKRIDVISMAIQAGLTVYDLEESELAYAPPFGSAKDPVNIAGFVASNALRGDYEVVHVPAIPPEEEREDLVVLDVRTPEEVSQGRVPGALNIPVDELRDRLDELPKDKKIYAYCGVGLRSYVANRILKQRGFDVYNVSGGLKTYRAYCPKDVEHPGEAANGGGLNGGCCTGAKQEAASKSVTEAGCGGGDETLSIDASGLQCPGPLLQMAQQASKMQPGQTLRVLATDPGFGPDVRSWCERQGHEVLSIEPEDGAIAATVRLNGEAAEAAAQPLSGGEVPSTREKTMVVFSGDLDRVMASMIIANGAAAMGDKVTIFFTFWGLNALRKEKPPRVKKGFLDRMFGMMMPRGLRKLKLSKMNMGGMGTAMMKHVMRKKNVDSLPELLRKAQENGVRLVACSMSMDVMGISREELIDNVQIGGVAAYLGSASTSSVNLFI